MTDLNWLAVTPEIVLLGMACLVALVDLFVTCPKRTTTYLLSMASLAVVAGLHLNALDNGQSVYAMQRMVVTDAMGHLLSLCATLAVMATLVYARNYAGEREMLKGELFSLAMLSLLGISIMIIGNNFLTIYLGLELMCLSLYALVALRRDHTQATEAAMKYFVLGALASGFMLYEFEYKPAFKDSRFAGQGRYVGHMAHEVEAVKPEAVFTMPDGHKGINYGLL